MFYIGRIIGGVGAGICCVVSPTYIGKMPSLQLYYLPIYQTNIQFNLVNAWVTGFMLFGLDSCRNFDIKSPGFPGNLEKKMHK